MGKFKTGGYRYCRTIDDVLASKKPILTDAGYNKVVIECSISGTTVTLPTGIKGAQLEALVNKGVDLEIVTKTTTIKEYYRLNWYKFGDNTMKFVNVNGSDIKTLQFVSTTATTGTVSTKSIPSGT